MPLSQHYEFYSSTEDYIYYFFKTSNGVIYEVSFKPTPYLFDSRFPFAEQVYESVIKVAESPPQVPIPLDIKVKKTIAQIFYDFFSDKERVIIYICDTADSRHRARFRKFSSWFEEFKVNQFVTVSTSISDPLHPLQLVYLNALILHRNNPYFVEIIDAFRKVTGGYSEEK